MPRPPRPRPLAAAALAAAVALGSFPWAAEAQDTSGTSSSSSSASYGWLELEKNEFCKTAPTPPSLLDERSEYPVTPFEEQLNAADRLALLEYRGENGVEAVMQSCPFMEATAEESAACTDATTEYATGLWLFAIPMFAGIFSLLLWSICCLVALCRCCRRCCLCSERKGPRPAQVWQKCAVAFVALTCSLTNFAAALTAFGYSGEVSMGFNDMLCQLLVMADETLNGSPSQPNFLGVDEGIQRISMVRRLLDVDGRAMTDVRAILDETASFAAAMDALVMRIGHMKRVLTLVGQHKIMEHTCWFCERSIGNNATGDLGLLNELTLTIQQSSADAMRSIQRAAATTLTGKPLVDVSSTVQRGNVALEVFKRGYAGTMVDGYGGYIGLIKTLEDARHTIFRFMCAFCVFHACVVSNVAIYQTRRSKAKYPGSTPAFVTWFCGFCAATLGLLFAGGSIMMAVPISEVCQFWRYDIFTHEGMADYYRQLGLIELGSPSRTANPLAVDVWRTCFAPNGTGDVLSALQLREKLDFQRVLHEGFVVLEDKMAGAVVDIAKFELLVSQARSFGGLFILAPEDPLPLEPNAASKMIGSSLDPDDREGPDGESLIYGLNTYASLIGGPGQYSFAHGTAGGGTLITATTPTAEEVSGELMVRQNALIYARLKEQLLSSPDVFRCDTMDATFQVVERTCGFEEFKASVLSYAEQVRDAGVLLGQEAQSARQLIAYDLQNSLRQLLLEVKALRELFMCRFLWKRWEDFDLSLCNVALPGLLQGALSWLVLAGSTLVLVLLHYKMWRHLLDNKVVGEELERFAKKYGYLSTAASMQ